MTIHIFDALVGSGKARALARYGRHLAGASHKVLFVQLTKHPIDKATADELQALPSAACLSAACGGGLLPVCVEAGTA